MTDHEDAILRQWRKCERLRLARKESMAAHERAKRDLHTMMLKQTIRRGIPLHED